MILTDPAMTTLPGGEERVATENQRLSTATRRPHNDTPDPPRAAV